MVSLQKKGRMSMLENIEELLDKETFRNESRTHVEIKSIFKGYIKGFKGYISDKV